MSQGNHMVASRDTVQKCASVILRHVSREKAIGLLRELGPVLNYQIPKRLIA